MDEYLECLGRDFAMPNDLAKQEPLLGSAPMPAGSSSGEAPNQQQQQAVSEASPNFENNILLLPEGIPAGQPQLVGLLHQQPPPAGTYFGDMSYPGLSLPAPAPYMEQSDAVRRLALQNLPSSMLPAIWNDWSYGAAAPVHQLLFGQVPGPHDPSAGWPLPRASVPQASIPVPTLRRPPLQRRFLVETGDVKRVMIPCGQRSVHVCVTFHLNHEYGLIDASLAKELKLALIPLPPDKRQPRESPQGIIKPTKYVELTLTDMEPILGKLSFSETQLRLCVFRSANPFLKLTLGRVAARTLGLETTVR
ncbi:hypothetical protein HJFPF1_09033 [Paramyrothecium foliicola]|nr:hypothetical protein HJFPF1_09033 [Paramyrothecium foliicola]